MIVIKKEFILILKKVQGSNLRLFYFAKSFKYRKIQAINIIRYTFKPMINIIPTLRKLILLLLWLRKDMKELM